MVLSVIGEHNAVNNLKSKLASVAPCSAPQFTYFSKLLIDQPKTKFNGLRFEKEDYKTVEKLLKEDILIPLNHSFPCACVLVDGG